MRRPVSGLLLASPPVLLVAVFIGLPVLNAVGLSLGYTGGLNETVARVGRGTRSTTSWMPTLAAYRDVMSADRFWSDFLVTLLITAVVTVAVLVLAAALALSMRLAPGPLSRLLPTLSVVPMFIPGVIGAWASLSFWSADGFIGSIITALGGTPPQLGFTTPMVMIAQVWTSLPFAVLMLCSAVASVPQALIDAARDCGAGTMRVIGTVIAPMTFVPTIIAATFTAIGVVGSFTVPFLTGPNSPTMLGVTMTRTFQAYGKPQQAVVMALLVFAIASVLGVVYVWANWRASREEGR